MTDWAGTPYEPRPVIGDEVERHLGSWGRKGKCAWPYSAWCWCPSQVRLPYQPSWRDRLARRLATAALAFATPTYRALLRGAYVGGLRCASLNCPRCNPLAKESA